MYMIYIWNYPAQGIMLLSEAIACQIKSPVPHMAYLPLSFWPGHSEHYPETIQAIAVALGCPPEVMVRVYC